MKKEEKNYELLHVPCENSNIYLNKITNKWIIDQENTQGVDWQPMRLFVLSKHCKKGDLCLWNIQHEFQIIVAHEDNALLHYKIIACTHKLSGEENKNKPLWLDITKNQWIIDYANEHNDLPTVRPELAMMAILPNVVDDFIAAAKSDAAKKYWFDKFNAIKKDENSLQEFIDKRNTTDRYDAQKKRYNYSEQDIISIILFILLFFLFFS